jgi:medium-chain acyl-[acyl-carrier-protein] hydrolase
MEIFLPALRADFEMTENYIYKEDAPLECPITAFGGLSDPKVTREKILAWKMHTSINFDSRFFAGDHFFIKNSESSILNCINLQLTRDCPTLSIGSA